MFIKGYMGVTIKYLLMTLENRLESTDICQEEHFHCYSFSLWIVVSGILLGLGSNLCTLQTLWVECHVFLGQAIWHLSMEVYTHVWRMDLICKYKRSFKEFLDPDSDPDHHQYSNHLFPVSLTFP